MRTLVWIGVLVVGSSTAEAGRLTGIAVHGGSRRPWVGIEVTAAPKVPGAAAGSTTRTEADGSFAFTLPPGDYVVTVHGGATRVQRSAAVTDGGKPAEVYVVLPVPAPPAEDDGYEPDLQPAVAFDGRPTAWSAGHDGRTPLLGRHDHLGIAALDARVAPTTSATTVAGALRLPGAPAIAAEFTLGVWSQPLTAAASRPGARGGQLDVELATGTDRPGAAVHLDLGPEARFAATVRSPREDRWIAVGVAGARDELASPRGSLHDVQLFQSLGFGDDGAHRGTSATFEIDALETWMSGRGRDLWSDGRLVIRTADRADTLSFAITAEALRPAAPAAPEVAARAAVSRLAGRIELGHRWRGGGAHTTVLGGEVGLGNAGNEEHGDLRGFVADTWTPDANWTFDGSVRIDRRSIGPARVDALLPRLAVQWNPTADEVALIASAERVARLDENYLGAWRAAPSLAFDQASLGGARSVGSVLHATLVARVRRDIEPGASTAVGLEAALASSPWHGVTGALTASTLDRALAIQASYRWRRLTAALIARSDHGDRTWGATARLRLRRVGDWASVGLELFDLERGGARSGKISFGADL